MALFPFRTGFGYDSHVFRQGGRLVLGGVEFPGHDGLSAHSDGDVLIHAAIDAIFGAAALGDIGSHFPDSDPRWKGADSTKLLSAAVEEAASAGWQVANLDATVVCESPKIAPRAAAIRETLAALLRTDVACVSVKGKTNERMDDVGAGRGIAAYAAVLLARRGEAGETR